MESKHDKLNFYFSLVTAICTAGMFLVLLIVAIILVPKAVNLMNTAQTTLDNMETLSEHLTV